MSGRMGGDLNVLTKAGFGVDAWQRGLAILTALGKHLPNIFCRNDLLLMFPMSWLAARLLA